METLKSTVMKMLNRNLKTGIFIIISISLLFGGCYEFNFVIQPYSAETNSTFEVQISTTTTDGNSNNYIPYFGVKLPIGWIVQDSIYFVSGTNSGYFVYCDSLVQEMNSIDQPPPGYYWWVCAGIDSVLYIDDDTYLFNPMITINSQAGTFYLDYMLGSSATGQYGGLNYTRSNNHIITVGLPDSMVVTNSNDSGPGSLRAAIDSIDFYGTITFDIDKNDTITLINQISIYKDVQIIGDENQPVVLSGNDTTRIFNIKSGRSPILSDLVITKGKTGNQQPYYFGGGIMVGSNASPIFSNLLICDNYASRGGGGISFGSNCTPHLENVTIRNNIAEIYYGGGISAKNCHIEFDSVKRCNIYNNTSAEGDDLYLTGNSKIILDTFTVLYPTSYHISGSGSTFDIKFGKYEQVDSTLYVSPIGDNNNNGLTPDNPLKTIKKAISLIRADSLHQNTINLLSGYYSKSTNGESFPIFLPDYVTLEGESDEEVIINSEEGSQRFVYGPISLKNNNKNQISNLTLEGGASQGGIYITNSSPQLNNLIIRNNNAKGIECYDSNPIIKNTVINDNEAGGIYLKNSNATISNTEIINNKSSLWGGGIYCEDSDPVFDNLLISNNEAGGWGGGLYLKRSNPDIRNVRIMHNTANEGGAIYCSNSNPKLVNVAITNNHARDYGGGIASSHNSNATLVNVTISNNSASIGGGALYCADSGNAILTNTILWENDPEEIYFNPEGSTNSVTLGWTNIEDGMSNIVTNNNGEINWLEGCIDREPWFIGDGDHPYQISDNSQCIDVGKPNTTNLPNYDPAGNPRIVNGRVDIGAYEWNLMVDTDEKPVEENNIQSINVYPNPTTNNVTISYEANQSGMINISLLNTRGILIKSWELMCISSLGQKINVNARDLDSGIYFLRLQIGKKVVTRKLVKL